jgi:hypothetical protein
VTEIREKKSREQAKGERVTALKQLRPLLSESMWKLNKAYSPWEPPHTALEPGFA